MVMRAPPHANEPDQRQIAGDDEGAQEQPRELGDSRLGGPRDQERHLPTLPVDSNSESDSLGPQDSRPSTFSSMVLIMGGGARARRSRRIAVTRLTATAAASASTPTPTPTPAVATPVVLSAARQRKPRMVTKRQLETAKETFLDRARQASAARGDEDDDGQVDICVEVAHGVTATMFDKIPSDWAYGLILRLRSDGTLELMDVETNEHLIAKIEAIAVVHAYAEQRQVQPTPQNLVAVSAEPATFAGNRYKPDVALAIGTVPIVIVEIEVTHRSVPAFIAAARNYLQDFRVQRVVVFKYFDPRTDGVPANHLVKAALAVVFERAPGARMVHGRHPIRVVQEISFGNAPLYHSVLRNLGKVPSITDPVVPRVVTIPRSPNEGLVIQRNQVLQSFVAAVPHDLNVSVDNQPQMTFRLHRMFCASANGWSRG